MTTSSEPTALADATSPVTSRDSEARCADATTGEPEGRRSLLATLGGIALGAAPVVMTVGFFTSPPQDSTSHMDYVTSMARALFLAALSANLIHYSWVLWTLGLLAVTALFRHRRGRTAGQVSAVVAAISCIQLSGLLLSDFYAIRVTQVAGAPAAADVEFSLGSSADVWLWSGKIAVVLLLVVFVLLAWSRAIAWWLPALPVVGVALTALLPLPLPVQLAVTIASLAPAYVAAHQLITGRRRAT